MESTGTRENDTELASAGDRIIEGREELVKNTTNVVIAKKLKTCKRAVKWWDEEVTEAITVRREAYARYTSNKTTAGWAEYAAARNKVQEMVEKGLWTDVINEQTKALMAE